MRTACCRVTQGAISFATKIQREKRSSTLKEAAQVISEKKKKKQYFGRSSILKEGALWKKQHSERSSTLKEAA
jgi:hypothetical protein